MKRLHYYIIYTIALLLTQTSLAFSQDKKETSFHITVLKTTGEPQRGMILKVFGTSDKFIGNDQGVISFKVETEKGFTRSAALYFPSDETRSVMSFPLEETETTKTFYIDSPDDLASYRQNNTTVSVEGIVKDTHGNAISGATVSIQGTGRRATTDKNGAFKIEADYNHPITIRANGKENLSLGINLFMQRPGEPSLITMFQKSSDKVYSVVDKMPEFQGGMKAFQDYLSRNLKYPTQAKKAKKEGVVAIQFIVEKDGQISSPTVVRSLEASMDSAAITVIRKMPRWTAGEDHGVSVRCKYSVPVQFKINQPKPVDQKKANREAEMRQRAIERTKLQDTILRLCGMPKKQTFLDLIRTIKSPAEGLEVKAVSTPQKKK